MAVYFGFVQVAKYRFASIKEDMKTPYLEYTNTIQLRDRLRVLQEQIDLQFAALDCYKAVSDLLPSELTLDSFNFERGTKLTLFGTASANDVLKINDFNSEMRKVMVRTNQPLFSKVWPATINPRPGGQSSWNFVCELQRSDTE